MSRILRNRLLSILLVTVFALSLSSGCSGDAAKKQEIASMYIEHEEYFRDLNELILTAWHDDYIVSIEIRVDDPVLTVNGEAMGISPGHGGAPYIDDKGVIMLPIQALSELLGYKAVLDSATQSLSISGDNVEISLTTGAGTMTVNGKQVQLDTAPVIRNNAVFVSGFAMKESLLFDVAEIDDGMRAVLTKPYQMHRLIVKTGDASVLDRLEGVTQTLTGPGDTYVIQFTDEWSAKTAAEQLARNNAVEYSDPDVIISTDSNFKSWGVQRIGADKYIAYLTSSNNLPRVTVAVLDTGIDASHPFLVGKVTSGRNFIDDAGDTNTRDNHRHGTHVAGVIAESTYENVEIIPVKVLGDDGRGSMLALYMGIIWAADNGAEVINMSLGGAGTIQIIRDGIIYANSKNAVSVAAAGNDNADLDVFPVTPAYVPEAITVAACDNRDQKASFSNYGSIINVSAPGVGINSSIPGGGFASLNGTSMAAPHVAAAVALLKSDERYTGLSPTEMQTMIHSLTDDAGTPGFDIVFGHGIVNLTKVDMSAPTPEPPTNPSNGMGVMRNNPISSGNNHSVAVDINGNLWGWGQSRFLGFGDQEHTTPSVIMSGVSAASAMWLQTFVIKTDGSLWAWGDNRYGQLGDSTITIGQYDENGSLISIEVDNNRPSPVKIMDDVAAVSSATRFTLAIRTDGSLWAWGNNEYGQLGNGTTTDQLSPVRVLDDVVAVSAGARHTLAIRTDGSLWAWGSNEYGQLGDGTNTDRLSPVRIMDGVVAINAGGLNAMAIKTDGSLWAWGDNRYGQLGDGTTTDMHSPVRIIENVIAVSTFGRNSMALTADGSLWTWGSNWFGLLGDDSDRGITDMELGSTAGDRPTPVKIMDNVVAISAGNMHSLAVKSDGTIWTWGQFSGVIGDGRQAQSSVPEKVMDGYAPPR